MNSAVEKIHFSTRVLGAAAAYRLEKRMVTQTLLSNNSIIKEAIINGRVSAGDRLEIVLDGITAGLAGLVSMEAVNWEYINLDDARRGGFDTLADLEQALKRAGYRFKPLKNYQLYRIQFSWLEEVYA